MTDLELLARLIQCEAGGEGDNGMKAVATVVMNRVQTLYGEYGRYNTVEDVIFAPRQFVCAMTTVAGQYNAQNLFNMNPGQEHYDIAEWALNGGKLGMVGRGLYSGAVYRIHSENSVHEYRRIHHGRLSHRHEPDGFQERHALLCR